MQIFNKIGQKMKEPWYFKCQFFQNPGQKSVFLSDFWLIFGSDDQPSNACKI